MSSPRNSPKTPKTGIYRPEIPRAPFRGRGKTGGIYGVGLEAQNSPFLEQQHGQAGPRSTRPAQHRKTDTMKPTPTAAHAAAEQALHALYETAHLLSVAVDCYNTEAAAAGRRTAWQAQLLRPAYHRLTDAMRALGADEWEAPCWDVRPAHPPAPQWPGYESVPF